MLTSPIVLPTVEFNRFFPIEPAPNADGEDFDLQTAFDDCIKGLAMAGPPSQTHDARCCRSAAYKEFGEPTHMMPQPRTLAARTTMGAQNSPLDQVKVYEYRPQGV